MNIFINILLVSGALCLSIIMIRKKVNLGLVMLMDSVIIALIARMTLKETMKYIFDGALSTSTIKLIIILFLIMMLENIMRNTGMIKSMVDNLKALTGSNRVAAALLPAALGLLPSPGGARFSCPMVQEVALDNTDDENKAFINHWFRHTWLDGFILYPGAILASELLQISVITFFIHLGPFILVNVILGWIFALSKVKKERIVRTKPVAHSLKLFLKAILPIVILIFLYVLLLNHTVYSLEIAACVVVAALLIIKKYSFKMILKTVMDAFPINLFLIIVGVMVFKEILLGSGAISLLSSLLNAYGIPTAILFILVPFIGGFTSGLAVSFVSLAFPILIPLGLDASIWHAAIAYTAGAIGGMVTPLHLCLVMTADYFKVSLAKLIKRLIIAEIPLMTLSIVLLFVVMV